MQKIDTNERLCVYFQGFLLLVGVTSDGLSAPELSLCFRCFEMKNILSLTEMQHRGVARRR